MFMFLKKVEELAEPTNGINEPTNRHFEPTLNQVQGITRFCVNAFSQ